MIPMLKFRAEYIDWYDKQKRFMYRTLYDRNWYSTPHGSGELIGEALPEDKRFPICQFVCTDRNGNEVYGGHECNGDKIKCRWQDENNKWKRICGHVIWHDGFLGWGVKSDMGIHRLSSIPSGSIELIEEASNG